MHTARLASVMTFAFVAAFASAGCGDAPPATGTDEGAIATVAPCATDPATSLPAVPPTPALAPAMAKLNFLRGTWVGRAKGTNADGSSFDIVQTERVGPLLGGDVFLIEGRGFSEKSPTAFNALGVLSWNSTSGKYEMHAWQGGRNGAFELKLTDNGYVWEQPAGPSAVVRFTATFDGGRWHQVGEFISEGRPPVQTFEMDLTRTGDTEWPGAMAVVPDVGR